MAHTVFLASTLVLAASLAYGLPPKSDASTDWKYAHGWDGTVLPSIGTPVALPNDTATLTPLTVGGIYICENINWGGHCGYAVQPTNRCIKLGSDWKNKISSFGPDICTGCTLFARDDCRWEETPKDPAVDYTGSWFIDYPGDASGGLGNDPRKGAWNDRVKSFACEYEC